MSSWKSYWSFAFALVIGVGSLLGGKANAGVLWFESEVTVLAGSSVGSTVLSSDTPVKFSGLFDPATTLDSSPLALTPFTSLQIEIGTLGTFVADNPADSVIYSLSPAVFGLPGIGVYNLASGGGYVSLYGSASQPFNYAALSPNEFSMSLSTIGAAATITLDGGAGDFTFVVSETAPTTASIVPEPTSMAIFGLGSMLVVARRVRRARSAA